MHKNSLKLETYINKQDNKSVQQQAVFISPKVWIQNQKKNKGKKIKRKEKRVHLKRKTNGQYS